MRRLPKEQRLYLLLIYALTVFFTIILINNPIATIQANQVEYTDIILFMALIGITESFTVTFKSMSFSTSFAVTIASYILFGPLISIIIVTVGFLCRVLKVDGRGYIHIFNTPIFGTIFNVCALVLPIIISNYFYMIMGGTYSINKFEYNIFPLIVFVIVYLIVNILIMSVLMGLKTRKNILYCFLGNIKIGFFNSVVMLPIGILLAIVFTEYNYWGLIIVVFTVIMLRYTLLLYSNTKEQLTDTVEALMNAIDARDMYTEGHSRRVAEISVEIARELKLSQWEIEKLHIAAMLHDVGKIGISDNILNKPGKLTDEEYNIIKEHPTIGVKILKKIKNIDYVHKIVEQHHERYDGKGYPHGLKGDEVDIQVYIVHLADTVDAMTSDRPYRKGLSKAIVKAEIEKYSGTQFHPKVANAYLNILKREEKMEEKAQAKVLESSVTQ
ncbi:HD-GYP domain-containing protein [Clostridium culturomicium]|uniref:HD-GYP domain-containing protein n=1 Tax=Clostridium culturomicium TaxID=1499683 RepID=UPI00058C380F|nr:HD-GYP domain-containing protein [Clostridium culturomicium]